MINPNILDEENWMAIVDNSKYLETHDELDLILRCNNCGQATPYGKTRMISGFVGCDNKINVNGKEVECYFGDLQPRVINYKESYGTELYEKYRTGKVYRWRDGAE